MAFRPVPKPKKGSRKSERQKRKRELKQWRDDINEWVLEADKYICQNCGAGASHAHHVHGRGGSPDDDCEQPHSRLSVCNDCHVAYHDCPANLEPISKERMVELLEEANKRRPSFLGIDDD